MPEPLLSASAEPPITPAKASEPAATIRFSPNEAVRSSSKPDAAVVNSSTSSRCPRNPAKPPTTMFIDSARITVQGGDGGRGCVSFRREKYSSRGGPDGGDGGDGGDVRLLASSSASTLLVFRNKNQIAARSGTPGRRQDQHGRKGPDTRFKVPVGTLVIDVASDEILFDLAAEGDEVVVARGGRGGSGNARFKSSTQRAPRRAGEGAPGENRLLRLELRLLADVGIVGAPNAGKSSLLARISNSTPRIADYPFSTLEPVLGVVDLGDYKSCVAADVPGLIKGAHVGKGLGSHFLRHIQRTRVLVHVVDLFPPEGGSDEKLRCRHGRAGFVR